jgi:hypothetical protein
MLITIKGENLNPDDVAEMERIINAYRSYNEIVADTRDLLNKMEQGKVGYRVDISGSYIKGVDEEFFKDLMRVLESHAVRNEYRISRLELSLGGGDENARG